MNIRCNYCEQEYDDTLNFCPFCGELKSTEETDVTPPLKLNILDDITEENVVEFSSFNEPTTEYEAFKNAINYSYDRSDHTGTEEVFTDYSDEYIIKNKEHKSVPDINYTFRHYYEDNEINKNGITNEQNIHTQQNKGNFYITGKSESVVSTFTYSINDIKKIISELLPLILGFILTFTSMSLIMKSDMATPLTVLPFFLIVLLFSSYTAITKYFSIFDKITIPVFLLLTTYFGYHIGIENQIHKNFAITFLCFGVQTLCIILKKRYLSTDNTTDIIIKIIILATTVIPLCFFITTSLKDFEMLILLTFLLFGIINIIEGLFDDFGIAVLVITFFPALAGYLLLKTKLNETINPNISVMIMLILFIAPTVAFTLIYNNYNKDKAFELSIINIISFIFIHLSLFIIYLCLASGVHNQYLILADQLFNWEAGTLALMIIAGNCIYPLLSYLVRRTK